MFNTVHDLWPRLNLAKCGSIYQIFHERSTGYSSSPNLENIFQFDFRANLIYGQFHYRDNFIFGQFHFRDNFIFGTISFSGQFHFRDNSRFRAIAFLVNSNFRFNHNNILTHFISLLIVFERI